jgi:hypothetical protein
MIGRLLNETLKLKPIKAKAKKNNQEYITHILIVISHIGR